MSKVGCRLDALLPGAEAGGFVGDGACGQAIAVDAVGTGAEQGRVRKLLERLRGVECQLLVAASRT